MSLEFLETELEAVKSVISAAARMADPRAGEAVEALVGSGGKFLRPRILLLSAMTAQYNPGKIRPLAAAVELLHTATLLHDDVIDDSPYRRGLPAAHTRVGCKDAVLSGDFLFSRCFLLAAESTNPENAKALARAIDVIVQAEIAQDSGRWQFSPSVRSCIRKIGGKTAMLFSLAARSGASEAKASKQVVSALSRAAWAAGVAFQIQDDILDWVGDERQLGKTTMNDLAEGFCTLPLALALSEAGSALLPLLDFEAIRAGSATEIAAIVKNCGALAKAGALAAAYQGRSISELEKIPRSFARDQLELIFSSFTKRTK